MRTVGISVLTRLATPKDDHPTIVTRLISEPSASRIIGIVERLNGRLSPATTDFRDILRESWVKEW